MRRPIGLSDQLITDTETATAAQERAAAPAAPLSWGCRSTASRGRAAAGGVLGAPTGVLAASGGALGVPGRVLAAPGGALGVPKVSPDAPEVSPGTPKTLLGGARGVSVSGPTPRRVIGSGRASAVAQVPRPGNTRQPLDSVPSRFPPCSIAESSAFRLGQLRTDAVASPSGAATHVVVPARHPS